MLQQTFFSVLFQPEAHLLLFLCYMIYSWKHDHQDTLWNIIMPYITYGPLLIKLDNNKCHAYGDLTIQMEPRMWNPILRKILILISLLLWRRTMRLRDYRTPWLARWILSSFWYLLEIEFRWVSLRYSIFYLLTHFVVPWKL